MAIGTSSGSRLCDPMRPACRTERRGSRSHAIYEVTSAWLVVPCGAAARADRSTPRAQGHGPTGSGSTATTTARSSQQWANLKGVELANLAADTLAEVTAAAERGIQRIRATHWLAYSFLRHCGLSLW
jgi:hypothetical protein